MQIGVSTEPKGNTMQKVADPLPDPEDWTGWTPGTAAAADAAGASSEPTDRVIAVAASAMDIHLAMAKSFN